MFALFSRGLASNRDLLGLLGLLVLEELSGLISGEEIGADLLRLADLLALADNVEVARYPSARDRGGVNVAVFSPRAFARRVPENLETWLCVATKERVELSRKDYLGETESMVFERAVFEVKGRLPAPPGSR